MAGEQFLGDAVAVVVGQHMHRLLHAQVVEQRLLQIGLFQQAIIVVHRLGRFAEPQHVARDHQVALGQRLPHVVPVPAGGGEPMNQQQRFALPGHPVTDLTATEDEFLATFAPGSERDFGEWHQLLYPGSCRSNLRSSAGQASAPPIPWALFVTAATMALAPARICGSMLINSAAPFCASTWISQARWKINIIRNVSAMVPPQVSRPWLCSIRKLLSPRSACKRAFSSWLSATPS